MTCENRGEADKYYISVIVLTENRKEREGNQKRKIGGKKTKISKKKKVNFFQIFIHFAAATENQNFAPPTEMAIRNQKRKEKKEKIKEER